MMRPQISVQDLAVRAALEGKRDYVYQAAMFDPLAAAVLTIDQIWDMVDEMIAAHGQAMPEGIRD
jgi:alpha-galactosidase